MAREFGRLAALDYAAYPEFLKTYHTSQDDPYQGWSLRWQGACFDDQHGVDGGWGNVPGASPTRRGCGITWYSRLKTTERTTTTGFT